jgi:hypothetical protein
LVGSFEVTTWRPRVRLPVSRRLRKVAAAIVADSRIGPVVAFSSLGLMVRGTS